MKTILLLNNDILATEALQRVLRRLGFAVEMATDHLPARSKALGLHLDLILMEFNLDYDESSSVKASQDRACWCGTGLIRELRASGVRVPILVLGNGESPLYETATLDAGADDYILRSDDLNSLLARVNSHLRRREWDLSRSSHADQQLPGFPRDSQTSAS